METMILQPGKVNLEQLQAIYECRVVPRIDDSCKAGVDTATAIVAAAARGEAAVYGVNTGFGKLAQTRIAPEKTALLQRNLILSHCCGVGAALPTPIVRLIIALKLISLGRGASGVRWEVLARLQRFLEIDLIPVIPGQGSVGASGDLAPLAHMTAVLIGAGEASFRGVRMPTPEALSAAGLEPMELGPKEGLGLINGTQVSTALALAALFGAWRLAQTALISGAQSCDALMASTAPFRSELHELRGLPGQISAAASLRDLLAGSEIRESHLANDDRVQDPYSVRCQPQVMGACLDLLQQAGRTLEIEANAVTDNPIVIVEDGSIISGGNFHAQPVAFAADQCALAISEIGSITERRIATTVDPGQSFGLPAFLTPDPGLNSGFMIAEVTSAALMAENKQRATPCSIDSTPTSANQEDHVSMACHAARRLLDMNQNLATIIAIELLISTQGIEFRAPAETSSPLRLIMALIRAKIPALKEDRFMATDIEILTSMVADGSLVAALADTGSLPKLAPR